VTRRLHLDFETRSVVDLRARGVHIYAADDSTGIWCMAWQFDGDEEVQLVPLINDPVCPPRIEVHVSTLGTVVAHNASFEFELWNEVLAKRHGWPRLTIEQMDCTMARAYAMALPGSLDGTAAALGVAQQKDQKGKNIMLVLCRPRMTMPDGAIAWHTDPDKIERLHDYCKQDVRAECAIDERLMPLSAYERRVWTADHAINSRGVYVDAVLAERAMAIAELEKKAADARIKVLTGHMADSVTANQALYNWLIYRGVETKGIAKADVAQLLGDDADEDIEWQLDPDVREVLELRRDVAKTSTAKFKAMLAARSDDGRMRGMFQYHGASTGRWGGRKVQLQNLPRPTLEQHEIEEVIGWIVTKPAKEAHALISMVYGPPMHILADCIRGALCAAPGCELIQADFASVEGRGLAWLAGEEWKLHAFREFDAGRGPDMYIATYNKSFPHEPPITSKKDKRRQIGKVEELAFGYQGGVGAWATMSRGYRDVPAMTKKQINAIKDAWRGAHPATVAYWYALENAAGGAVRHPGHVFEAGAEGRRVRYKVKGSFLWCQLPSGRLLCYPYPRIMTVRRFLGEKISALEPLHTSRLALEKQLADAEANGKADKDVVTYMGENSRTHKWERLSTYGGKLSENVTQAVCRDLLADAILRCEAADLPVVIHVHDEVVCETRPGQITVREFEKFIAETPAWAEGFPMAAEGWQGERYRK
jgi:DNA polymerase